MNKQFLSDDSKIYFTLERRYHAIERRSGDYSSTEDNGIWVVDSDGNNVKQLKGGTTSFAFFHPNNKYFYFYGGTWWHHTQFYRCKLDGSDEDRLSKSTDYYGRARINPDGNRIVFDKASDLHDGNFNLWMMNDDGRNLIRLTNTYDYHSQPAFTPDGEKIVFIGRDDHGGGYDNIYTINYQEIEI